MIEAAINAIVLALVNIGWLFIMALAALAVALIWVNR